MAATNPLNPLSRPASTGTAQQAAAHFGYDTDTAEGAAAHFGTNPNRAISTEEALAAVMNDPAARAAAGLDDQGYPTRGVDLRPKVERPGGGDPDQNLHATLNRTPGGAVNDGVYTVAKGDTLSVIAKAHGATVSELAKINGISDPNKIGVGQKIKLKAAEGAGLDPNVDWEGLTKLAAEKARDTLDGSGPTITHPTDEQRQLYADLSSEDKIEADKYFAGLNLQAAPRVPGASDANTSDIVDSTAPPVAQTGNGTFETVYITNGRFVMADGIQIEAANPEDAQKVADELKAGRVTPQNMVPGLPPLGEIRPVVHIGNTQVFIKDEEHLKKLQAAISGGGSAGGSTGSAPAVSYVPTDTAPKPTAAQQAAYDALANDPVKKAQADAYFKGMGWLKEAPAGGGTAPATTPAADPVYRAQPVVTGAETYSPPTVEPTYIKTASAPTATKSQQAAYDALANDPVKKAQADAYFKGMGWIKEAPVGGGAAASSSNTASSLPMGMPAAGSGSYVPTLPPL